MNSNLISHLKTSLHYDTTYQEYLALEKATNQTPCSSPNTSNSLKRRRLVSSSTDSPKKTLIEMLIAIQPKFKLDGVMQQERLLKIVIMLVKCTLSISIVENKGFREYIGYIDPSFNMPSVQTVRDTGLKVLYDQVKAKILVRLESIMSLSMSLDVWSDAILRPFNGLLCQGY